MNKVLLILASLALSLPALGAQYSVNVTWPDPTPQSAGYSPVYDAEYRLDGGPATAVNDLTSPSFATAVTGNGGEVFEVRQRARNTQGGIVGNWNAWTAATLSIPPVTPLDQGAAVIQITITVP